MFDCRHILMKFRCSILNLHNFGRNQHFLIINQFLIVNLIINQHFQGFFQNKAIKAQNFIFF